MRRTARLPQCVGHDLPSRTKTDSGSGGSAADRAASGGEEREAGPEDSSAVSVLLIVGSRCQKHVSGGFLTTAGTKWHHRSKLAPFFVWKSIV